MLSPKQRFNKKFQEELDEKRGSCWVGYKQVGMKKKGDRMVPNCVPEEVEVQEDLNMKPTPRQKFNKNLKKAGYDPEAGAARLEKLLAKQKKEREERQAMREDKDKREYDYEGEMVKSDLRAIMGNAERIMSMIKDEDNLPEWCQNKITLAEDYVSTVANYLYAEMNEAANPAQQAAIAVNMKKKGIKPKYESDKHSKSLDDGLEMLEIGEALAKVPKDKETGLPKKYVAGVSDSTAKKRAAHFAKTSKMSDRDPKAYEPAPGDATAKTKESKHTKKYKQMYGEDVILTEAEKKGLAAKAEKSGISIGTLRKVYRRGVAAWNSGHRPGTTPQQWGMARVNSYITKGKGTYYGADKDLREEKKMSRKAQIVKDIMKRKKEEKKDEVAGDEKFQADPILKEPIQRT